MSGHTLAPIDHAIGLIADIRASGPALVGAEAVGEIRKFLTIVIQDLRSVFVSK